MPPLTSPQRVTRRFILQKARGQAFPLRGIALPLLVGIRFQVLFHSGYPGSFHLSLTVLVHYRSLKVFSLGEWTPLLPTGLACPVVLKVPGRRLLAFAYRAITLFGRPFQCRSASKQFFDFSEALRRLHRSLQPPLHNGLSLLHVLGLGSSPFARHYSGNTLFSSGY